MNYTVDNAITLFNECRFPGLYKTSYIVGLCVLMKDWDADFLQKLRDSSLDLPQPKHSNKKKMEKHTQEALKIADKIQANQKK